MTLFRLSMLVLSLGVVASACNCSRAPVKDTLKPDGEACSTDEECESSLCDKLPGKPMVCFRKCASVCKSGEICTALAPNDRYACVPERPGLCQTCTQNVDCPYPGDRCVEIGGAKVCTRDCSFDGQCPSSYRCADGVDVGGAAVTKQCQPTSGSCDCTAASAGQAVPCSETNSFGTCTGVRTCRPPAGYDACSARVPTTEACNGRDDDCNGMTDENLGETTCGMGECRRTISNCVNGTAQLCEPLQPQTEICDSKDNDCDGVVDEGFDKMTSLAHCGVCNNPCARPNAVPVCMGGMCGIASCTPGWVNADGVDLNGCELMCTPTGAEVCDGVDNDCDGLTDEGFVLASDPSNCGFCGRACSVANGNVMTYACVTSTCGILACRPGFADCDQQYANGCEKPTSADVNNCGSCNFVCSTPNGTPACDAGTCATGSCNQGFADCDTLVANGCEVQTTNDVDHCGTCTTVCPSRPNSTRTCMAGGCGYTCLPGFNDLDGLPANGCEYACTVSSTTDLPDLNVIDSNCDGIDGEVANSIFVAPPAAGGNDSNSGLSRSLPKATIAAALAAAVTQNKRDVLVASGTYVGQVVITAANKGVYGGYTATTWARVISSAATITGVNSPLVIGTTTTGANNVTVQALNFIGANAVGTAVTGYGARVLNSTGVKFEALTISAGSGTAGSNGSNGTAGAAGNAGSAGTPGCEDSDCGGFPICACTRCSQPQGGAGGTNTTCGRTGGTGGAAGKLSAAGSTGSAGVGGTSAGTGVPAGLSASLSSSDGNSWAVSNGYWGADGASGAAGSNGASGADFGTMQASGYVVAVTSAGGNGGDGDGGGGGGGGGGGSVDCDSYGGGGGGGGAGGCGGTGGGRGLSGGASIAVYLWNSTVSATGCAISSGNGGAGGNGGSGASGGAGGAGGAVVRAGSPPTYKGNAYGGGSEQDDGSNGAPGGRGGNGGDGGDGGAGGGGPTIGVARGGTTSVWSATGSTITTGTAGLGGSSPVGNGATGLKQNVY